MSHAWEKTLLSKNDNIKQALEKINNEALRVALVVNSEKYLLGVVTDGDVRRGLLKGLTLNDPVSSVMNCKPQTAKIGTSKEYLIELMKEKDLLFIPLVTPGGVLVGLETLTSALQRPKYQNPIFIMAGGFGTRLKPLTDNCPKPMLKVGGKPILETLIKTFIKSGFENFYISTHYMPEIIRDYFGDGSQLGAKIRYVHEEVPLGTGGALGLLPKNIAEDLPLIMINGDVLTKVDFEKLLEFHVNNNSDATMCVREFDYQIPYGVITGEGNKIKSMVEKPTHRFFINAGIYVISESVINSVPENKKIDMPTLLEKHMKERDNILMFPLHEYWLDIGRMDDFSKAQNDIYHLGIL